MNFADALRQAKHESGDPVLPGTLPVDESTYAGLETSQEATAMPQFNPAHDPAMNPQGGTTVRLELFLTPEQLGGLFRAVVATQHSVMTLREAANHVRVPAHILDDLARTGEIPAFLVDGKWRFPRNGVDEWMNMQTSKKEAS